MIAVVEPDARRVCWHPNCIRQPRPNHVCCGPHWYVLPYDLRDRIRLATAVEKELGLPLHTEAVEYFRSQMIGNHEVRRCRAANCRERIVRLTGSRRNGTRYHLWVLAETVEPGDTCIDWSRHKPHNCPQYRQERSS